MRESDDLKDFIREITLRFERGMLAHAEQWRDEIAVQREENRRYFDELRRQSDEIFKNTEEMRAEDRAGREALFRIFDKLDGRGDGPAPAG